MRVVVTPEGQADLVCWLKGQTKDKVILLNWNIGVNDMPG